MRNLTKDSENILTVSATIISTDTVNILIQKKIKIGNGSISYETVIDKEAMTEFSNNLGNFYYFWTPTETGTFKISYIKIDSLLVETIILVEEGCVQESGMTSYTETRKGFAFNNPDLIANNNWGNIITPDELRYVYAFGNELQAPNYQVITDETLQWYIDNAVGNVERDFRIKLIKRSYEAIPAFDETKEQIANGREEYIDFEWLEPFDFNAQRYRNYIYIKLRHRPILNITKCVFRDLSNGQIIDLLSNKWLKLNQDKGSIEAFPQTGTLAATPFSGQILNAQFKGGIQYNYPDGFFISYEAGFSNVRAMRAKWPELFMVIGKLAGINLLNDYGDGKTSAIASSSISMAGLSESISTTLSATSAAFGARVTQWMKELKEFYRENKNKYSGLLIGSL